MLAKAESELSATVYFFLTTVFFFVYNHTGIIKHTMQIICS
jgi:hypothetical protein